MARERWPITSSFPNDFLAASSPAWSFRGSEASNVSRRLAEPSSWYWAGTALAATVMLPIAAATATVRSGTTRSCCRHSRRNMRTAHRTSGRPAARSVQPGAGRPSLPASRDEERLRTRRSDGLIDDATVAQEDDAVGPRRQVRLVSDDDAGDAALGGCAQQAHDRLAVHRVERA